MRLEKRWADQAPWGGQRAPGLTTVGYFCDLGDSTLPLPVWVPRPEDQKPGEMISKRKSHLFPGERSAVALSPVSQETLLHPPSHPHQRRWCSLPDRPSAYPMGRRPSAAGARASRRAAARGGWPPAARTRWHRCARRCHTRRAPSGSDTARARTPGSPRTASRRGGRTARPRWRRRRGSSCRDPARSRRGSGGSGTATHRSARGTTRPGAPGPAPRRPARPGAAPAPAWRTGRRRAAARGIGPGRGRARRPRLRTPTEGTRPPAPAARA